MSTPALPASRGPLSRALRDRLLDGRPLPPIPEPDPGTALADDDLQLALYCCYELHYRSFAGVPDDAEWDPELLAWRRRLEAAMLRDLRAELPDGGHPLDVLRSLVDAPGPSLSGHVERHGTREQLLEFLVHRSAYQLKEADPHTWAIPRLDGAAKVAMVHLQADEYGSGDPAACHSALFARTLGAVGLDDRYGAYLELLPGTTLATTNLITLFGLHRALRGALVGHLALFEMTSVVPMGRYSRALERHGFGPDARRFYDAHVAADAVHEVIARRDLVARLCLDEPGLAADVAFGARAAALVEERFATAILDAWAAGRSSLLGAPVG